MTVYRGDGKGGFLPDPFTFAAGLDATGITVAGINGDGKPELLVNDAFGDLLVLLGTGDGTFNPGYSVDQNVAMAVSVLVPLVLAATAVIHASPLIEALRDRRRW